MGTPLPNTQRLGPSFFHKLWHLVSIKHSTAFFLLSFLTVFLFAISIYLSGLLLNPVPPIPSKITALAGSNQIDIVTLDDGRYRIAVKDFKEPLQLTFAFKDELPQKSFFMLRKGYDVHGGKSVASLSFTGSELSHEIKGSSSSYTSRHIMPLETKGRSLNLSIESLDEDRSQLILDEIGIYNKNPNRFQTSNNHTLKLILRLLKLCIGALGIFLIANLKRDKAALHGIFYVIALGLATYSSTIFVKFSPEWERDLKVTYASGPIQNGVDQEYYYGLAMATNILNGKGPIVDGGPLWYRMPGYGFLLSLIKAGTSYSIESLLQAAIRAVWFHIFLIISSLVFLFWAACRLFSPVAAIAAITGILRLPSDRLTHLIIESIMPAVAVFCLGSACVYLWHYYRSSDRIVALKYHILVHLSFAIWFSLRTDVVLAWGIVSFLLYGRSFRTWKFFLVPICFLLSISLSWAFFKMQYTGYFSMTTDSIGASFMGGLWEVPHQFIWVPADLAYYTWMDYLGLDYKTKIAANFAVMECFRFCFTFPFYVLSLIWHKFTVLLSLAGMGPAILFFITVPTIAVLIKYKRMQALLLGWMVFFNMPVFFIFYSSGSRFYDPALIGMIVVGCAFLFDREFYFRAKACVGLTSIVIALAFTILLFGKKFDEYFIEQDQLRYWSPFLDPKQSTLYVLPSKETPKIKL